jgi:hypothetical protein
MIKNEYAHDHGDKNIKIRLLAKMSVVISVFIIIIHIRKLDLLA